MSDFLEKHGGSIMLIPMPLHFLQYTMLALLNSI